jgi:hypothetical protein
MYYFLDYFFTKRSNIKKNSLQLIFHYTTETEK